MMRKNPSKIQAVAAVAVLPLSQSILFGDSVSSDAARAQTSDALVNGGGN